MNRRSWVLNIRFLEEKKVWIFVLFLINKKNHEILYIVETQSFDFFFRVILILQGWIA
jgi:hypothetical protein